MRKLGLAALLLLLAGGGFLWYQWVQRQALQHLQETAARVAKVDLQAELDVDLSLKGITLSQGEKGELHWQLSATQAQYLQEEGLVEVTEPLISYRVGQGEGLLSVQAPKGSIRQEQGTARLWPTVHATYEQNQLTAGELVYSEAERSLTLSGGVTLTGAKFVCRADQVRYLLVEDLILAENGVDATVYVDAGFMEPQGESPQ